jgi:hypothetical protein
MERSDIAKVFNRAHLATYTAIEALSSDGLGASSNPHQKAPDREARKERIKQASRSKPYESPLSR